MTAPSGYGGQTREFVTRIAQSGYKVAIAANYGLQGAPYQTPDGIVVYPQVADSALNDVINGHYQDSKSELVISLYDAHAYNPDVFRQFPWCAWTPVDCTPALPSTVNSLRAARWTWAMSRHGETQLKAAGIQNITYMPHGFDRKVFAPRDRSVLRGRLSSILGVNLIDKYLVMMNSANKGAPSRKGFYEAFAAFKLFSDAHPEAMLYIHSEMSGVFAGENLPAICDLVGLDRAKVVYAPQYQLVCGMLNNDYLADFYNAADVFLSTSHGEGFGCPVVEAQLCGCPVVVSDNSALTELCMTGWTVKTMRYMPVVGVTWERPIVAAVVDGLERAYAYRGNAALRDSARQKAMIYDADKVFTERMLPAIHAMQAEIYAVPTPKQVIKKRVVVTEQSNGKVLEPVHV